MNRRFLSGLLIGCIFASAAYGAENADKAADYVPQPSTLYVPEPESAEDEKEALPSPEALLKNPVRILIYSGKAPLAVKLSRTASASFAEKRGADRDSLIVNGELVCEREFCSDFREGACDEIACSGELSVLEAGGIKYRGLIKIYYSKGITEAVNYVSLEDYLRGVVPKELCSSELEAMKAQAVCARTYALSRIKGNESLWDLRSDTISQVYGGCAAERAGSDRAVQETEGLVLTYNGSLASQALYHSACGGRTERSGAVFFNDIAYLKSVECRDASGQAACAESKYAEWKAEWTPEELGREVCSYLGRRFSPAEGLEILETGDSGRVCRLKILFADKSEAVLEKDDIRRALHYINYAGNRANLPSVKFEIVSGLNDKDEDEKVQSEAAETDTELQNAEDAAENINGGEVCADKDILPLPVKAVSAENEEKQEEIRLSSEPLKKSAEHIKEPAEEKKHKKPKHIVIAGSGWGHGVGLCQTGTIKLAAEGRSFAEILQHYYTGTEIEHL